MKYVKGHAGPLTYALIGLLATFAVADSVAAATHYRYGETFSHWSTDTIRAMPPWARWTVRVLVFTFALSFGPHIAFGTPLLP